MPLSRLQEKKEAFELKESKEKAQQETEAYNDLKKRLDIAAKQIKKCSCNKENKENKEKINQERFKIEPRRRVGRSSTRRRKLGSHKGW